MQTEHPYYDFVRIRRLANPSIEGLRRHLKITQAGSSSVVLLEYSSGRNSPSSPVRISAEELSTVIENPSPVAGRVLLIENIEPSLINSLGKLLDIDPVFFADYVATDFGGIDKAPLTPFRAFFPSQLAQRGHLHIHYQQVIDLGQSKDFAASIFQLKTESNASRSTRLLPHLKGRQLGLARGCCSILLKQHEETWYSKYRLELCQSKVPQDLSLTNPALILVDPPVKAVFEEKTPGHTYPAKPLHGGFEDFGQPPAFSENKHGVLQNGWDKGSMLSSLIRYLQSHPPGFQVAKPNVLSIGYYPIRIALAEWIMYLNVVSRYLMYYRYSLQTMPGRQHEADIVDLQRWPRRINQSQLKLTVLKEFISYWLDEQMEKKPWEMILSDIDYLQSHLREYSFSMERAVPVATAMVQLLDVQQSGRHAANVTLLTYIALVFVPLSWVTGLFSMSERYSPGQKNFWVYFATAVPLCLVVLFVSVVPYYRQKWMMAGLHSSWRQDLRRILRAESSEERPPAV